MLRKLYSNIFFSYLAACPTQQLRYGPQVEKHCTQYCFCLIRL